MEFLIAIGHFVGALVALAILMVSIAMFGQWEQQRYGERLRQELSLKLQVPVEEVDSLEWDRELSRMLEERFSEEHFRNRLADLLGTVLTIWLWLAAAVISVLYVGIAWVTFPDQLGTAVWVWSIIGAWALFSFFGMAFSFLCNLLIGRYPGQPKQSRNVLFEILMERTRPRQ